MASRLRALVDKLRRRRVFRVAGVYAVVALVVGYWNAGKWRRWTGSRRTNGASGNRARSGGRLFTEGRRLPLIPPYLP